MKIRITKGDLSYTLAMTRRKALLLLIVLVFHVLVFFLWWGRHTLTQPVTVNPVVVTLLPAEPSPASTSSVSGKASGALPAQGVQKDVRK